jgi:hypothetical protein
MGEIKNAYKILVGKAVGKRPRGRHSCRWKVDIRVYIKEIGWDVVDWVHLALDRDRWLALVNVVTNLWVL